MPETSAVVKNLLRWYRRNARDLPWRRGVDAYGAWIAEVMLQQTRASTVIPYWKRWLASLPTVDDLAKADSDQVLKLWEGLGYYARARNLRKAAQAIQENHEGRFPEQFGDILALPGIGPYTAGAIASIAFGQARPALDGNVIRVLCRVDGVADCVERSEVKRRLWNRAEVLVLRASRTGKPSPSQTQRPPNQTPNPCGDFNQALMELGATVCLPRRPLCDLCPLRRICRARKNGLAESLPNLGKRRKSVRRNHVAVVLHKRGRFLVRRRAAKEINGGLWEFPSNEADAGDPGGFQWLEKVWRQSPDSLRILGEIKHSITVHRITLKVYAAEVRRGFCNLGESYRWILPDELERLAFTGSHGKIVQWIAASRCNCGQNPPQKISSEELAL